MYKTNIECVRAKNFFGKMVASMRAFKQKERMNAGAKSALFATMADAEIAAIANFLANQ